MLTEHASQTMSVASAHPDKVLFVFAEAGDENIKLTLVNAAETAFPENAVLSRDRREHLSQNNAERTALFDQVAAAYGRGKSAVFGFEEVFKNARPVLGREGFGVCIYEVYIVLVGFSRNGV